MACCQMKILAVKFTNKTRSTEESYESHIVTIGDISGNMAKFLRICKYGATSETDLTTMCYYFAKFI